MDRQGPQAIMRSCPKGLKRFYFLEERIAFLRVLFERILVPCHRKWRTRIRIQKTRIHHQHLCLGEERPGLHGKDMKKSEETKIFFEEAFSTARMRPYYDRYPDNPPKAIRHYEMNIRYAEALFPSLSVFEVTLRNALIRELERLSGKKEWYDSFRKHPVLNSLYKYVLIASRQIRSRGETVTADKINGELTLGFWVSLFNAQYEKYLWKDLRRAFPFLPKTNRKRKTISAPLNAIRSLRNRVYHNEAISWNIKHLAVLHQLIIQTLAWMNPQVVIWLNGLDRFNSVSRHVKMIDKMFSFFKFSPFFRNRINPDSKRIHPEKR